jgi:hypothetical protein
LTPPGNRRRPHPKLAPPVMATTSRLNPFAPPAPQNWKASSIPSNGTLAGPGRRAGLGSQLRSSWRRTNRRQAHSAAHRRRSMRRVCGLATLSTWRAIEGQWIDRRLVAACPQACAAPGGFAALRGSAWLSPARPRAGSTGPSAWPPPTRKKNDAPDPPARRAALLSLPRSVYTPATAASLRPLRAIELPLFPLPQLRHPRRHRGGTRRGNARPPRQHRLPAPWAHTAAAIEPAPRHVARSVIAVGTHTSSEPSDNCTRPTIWPACHT